MRLIPALLLSVALATAAAGCFGKDEPPTTTTPTPTVTASPTTGTPTPATPTSGGNTTTPPPKPAPKEVFSGSASFQGTPTPDANNPTGVIAPSTTAPFTADPVGYTTLTLNVTWATGSGPGIAGSELRIQMLDPTGAPIGTACVAPVGPHQAPPAACTQTATIPATGGAYSMQYTGSGTLTATVQVVAS